MKLNGGREKIFEVRSLYNDITFIDEFLTPEFAEEQGLFSFHWSNQKQSFQVKSREFKEVKEKLLTQLTNHGNPFIYVVDPNHKNRGELLLEHQHKGVDLRKDYAELALKALHRLWKRPVCLKTIIEGKGTTFRVDGSNFETEKD